MHSDAEVVEATSETTSSRTLKGKERRNIIRYTVNWICPLQSKLWGGVKVQLSSTSTSYGMGDYHKNI